MDIRQIGWDIEWIRVAEGRNQWRALVNTGVNARVLQNAGNFLGGLESTYF